MELNFKVILSILYYFRYLNVSMVKVLDKPIAIVGRFESGKSKTKICKDLNVS